MIQLALGASPMVVILVAFAVGTGLFGFLALGAFNSAAWLSLFYVLGNVLVALFAKTLFFQPLDGNLYEPLTSYVAVAISTSALVAAIVLVRRINFGKPLFVATSNRELLSWLCWGSFYIAVVAWIGNQYFQGPGGAGFGGIAIFRSLILMAVIARAALLIESSNGASSFDARLGLILLVGVLFGLISNSKSYAAYPIVSYFFTVIFYQRVLSRRHIALFLGGLIVFVVVIAPLIQALRYMGQQQMSIDKRADLVLSSIESIASRGNVFRYNKLANIAFSNGYYYNYFGGQGRAQMLVGRYASVQQIDPVIALTDKRGEMGGAVIWPALTRLLPHFLFPGKPKYGAAYHIVVALGLASSESGKYPTVPLAGQAYAAYGIIGVLIVPFLSFFIFSMALKKLGWHLYRNVYAIFFFTEFIVIYANQGDLGQYAAAVLRNFPLFGATFWLIGRSYRLKRARSRVLARLGTDGTAGDQKSASLQGGPGS